MTPAYATCRCAECEHLDRLPVRLHGIPHAVQPNFLMAYAPQQAPPAYVPPPEQLSCDILPLFAGSLEPTLF